MGQLVSKCDVYGRLTFMSLRKLSSKLSTRFACASQRMKKEKQTALDSTYAVMESVPLQLDSQRIPLSGPRLVA